MTAAPRAWLSWSSGKDAALSLAAVRGRCDVEVVGLLTTVNAEADRVAIHGVRRELLDAQADRLGLPVHVVELPWPCPNEVYEERMAAASAAARDDGVTAMVFGDIRLADVRRYREEKLAGTGVRGHFPLWGRETDVLAREMLAAGLRATLTCVDLGQLDASFAGRPYDEHLLADLPDEVDPCGENGEFHTFVQDAPGFSAPVRCRPGVVVERDGFAFADLLPADGP